MLDLKSATRKAKKGVQAATPDPPQNPLVGQYYGPRVKSTNVFRPAIKGTKSRVFEFETMTVGSTETEIIRKKSMMNLESGLAYKQLGFSLRSYETVRAAMLWTQQLLSVIKNNEEDRKRVSTLEKKLAGITEEFFQYQKEKRETIADMEVALTQASQEIHQARKRALDLESEVRRRGVQTLTPEEAHPETAAPSVPVDPALILQGAREEILEKEQGRKKARKHPREAET